MNGMNMIGKIIEYYIATQLFKDKKCFLWDYYFEMYQKLLISVGRNDIEHNSKSYLVFRKSWFH